MPNSFDNPYLASQGGVYEGEWNWQDLGLPEEYWGFEPIQYQIPGLYEYQGMNQDIMGAIQNVFTGGGGQGAPIDFLPGQWEEWGFTEEDLISGFETSYSYGDEGLTMDWTYGSTNPMSGTEQLGQGYFANIFDPESLAATLSSLGGLEGEAALSASEVRALTPEMIDKTTQAYYNPYEEIKREDLVGKLHERRGEAQTGGFAGAGQRQSGLSEAERLYRSGYGDILSDIEKLKGQASSDVMDTIFGWQEQIAGQ